MDKVAHVKQAYAEMAQMFAVAAACANDETVEEVESGLAQEFWRVEIDRALFPLAPQEAPND